MSTSRTCGIYAIVNIITGKLYVGQSLNIERRWRGHRCDLKYGRHGNPRLQHAWNAYGPAAFKLDILEVVAPEDLSMREVYWIEQQASADRTVGYNCRTGGGTGGAFCEEARERMSVSARRRPPVSEQTRQRMSEAGRKRTPVTDETRRKLSAALQGHPVAPETVRKVIATRRARGNYSWSEETKEKYRRTKQLHPITVSEDTRRKIGDAHRGKTMSSEAREKLSKAATVRFSSQDERRKTSEATRRAMADPAVREKMSAGKRGKESALARAHRERLSARPVSDETRQKRSASHHAYWEKKRETLSPDLLTTVQAAAVLGVTATCVRQYIRAGRLPAHWQGDERLIARADLLAFKRPQRGGSRKRRA